MDAHDKIDALLDVLKDCDNKRLMDMAHTESHLIHESLFSDSKRTTIKHMRALEAILDELYAR